MEKPKYILIAGINGAGKSTLYQTYPNLFKNTKRVNADEILRKNHGDWQNQKDNIRAGRETVKQIQYNFANQISFHQETTLSSSLNGFKKNIQKAKAQGYEVSLLYVALDSPERAIERVKQRVAKGGHGIPNDIITKRYFKSLENLKEIIHDVDSYQMFENTQAFNRITNKNETELEKWINNHTALPRKEETLMQLKEQGEKQTLNIVTTDLTTSQLEKYQNGLTAKEWLTEDLKTNIIENHEDKTFSFPKDKMASVEFNSIDQVEKEIEKVNNQSQKTPKM